jgi:hypothetical protein
MLPDTRLIEPGTGEQLRMIGPGTTLNPALRCTTCCWPARPDRRKLSTNDPGTVTRRWSGRESQCLMTKFDCTTAL